MVKVMVKEQLSGKGRRIIVDKKLCGSSRINDMILYFMPPMLDDVVMVPGGY